MTDAFTSRDLDIVIVANFTGDSSSSNNRFNDLARRFSGRGARVELITSDFSHMRLARRPPLMPGFNYQVTQVPEPGYRKNVSLRRLFSQFVFSRNVGRYLKSRRRAPDVVVCAVPPPEAARVVARYARRVGAFLVVDIQDLWPEAFRLVAGPLDMGRFVFGRMRRSSALAFRAADMVVGVSQTYVDTAVRHLGPGAATSVAFLGTDVRRFDEITQGVESTPDDVQIKLVYVGSLSHSYDLVLVMDALNLLEKRGRPLKRVEFVVLGDGPMREEFQRYADSLGVNVTFRGRLPYPEMARELKACHIAVNPIASGSMASIINKVGDYAAAALPVINTQESEEYRGLVDDYGAGINCTPGDIYAFSAAIERLIDDSVLRLSLGEGNRRMADTLFDRSTRYEAVIDQIINLVRQMRSSGKFLTS